MRQEWSSLVVVMLLAGCLPDVVALSPEASSVQIVHDADKPLHCDVLGKITGSSRSADAKEGQNGAENDFRNHAAELKGNFAFVEAERNGPVGTSSQKDYFLGGKALRCQTEEMQDAQDKADAAAREQKEKDQAAQEQKEADEKKAAKGKKAK
jgi:hypothetical protein